MRLIFARHGESQANVERIISNRDLPHHLTETGRVQATALAECLAAGNVVAIYASPLLRAQETAQIIAARLDLSVVTVDALREFDCGVAEGRGDAEAWQLHNRVMQAWDDEKDYDRRIEGGESFNDMRTRFPPFVEMAVAEYGAGTGDVICITHGALLIQMLPLVVANVDRPFTATHGLGNCVPVVIQRVRNELVCLEWGDHVLISASGL